MQNVPSPISRVPVVNSLDAVQKSKDSSRLKGNSYFCKIRSCKLHTSDIQWHILDSLPTTKINGSSRRGMGPKQSQNSVRYALNGLAPHLHCPVDRTIAASCIAFSGFLAVSKADPPFLSFQTFKNDFSKCLSHMLA